MCFDRDVANVQPRACVLNNAWAKVANQVLIKAAIPWTISLPTGILHFLHSCLVNNITEEHMTELFALCVLYFVRDDKIKMFNQYEYHDNICHIVDKL